MTYHNTETTCLIDTDGTILNETDDCTLLNQIIRRNDVATLNRYLAKFPDHALATGEVYYYDPFWIAASLGSTEVLRVLLEHYKVNYDADPSRIVALDQRGFLLLNVACQHAQLDTALFLLDSQPPLGEVRAWDRDHCETALLAAAASLESLEYLSSKREYPHHDRHGWARDCVARGEELMNLLLDRGASACDAIVRAHTQHDGGDDATSNGLPPQPLETVLGRAVSRGSYELVRRLLDEGADVHARQLFFCNGSGAGFGGSEIFAFDVTALHLGSFYWNAEGIRALLDHRRSVSNDHDHERENEHDGVDLFTCRDSTGRLPLHWASAGPGLHDEYLLPDDTIVPHIVSTFQLLVAGNPRTINDLDHQGATPLYYAVGSHAACGSRHSDLAIRFLCAHGADARLPDVHGHTVLHVLALRSIDGDPIAPALLDLLVEHGADVTHADMDDNTALYLMARHLRQVEAARHLVRLGADVHARNAQGNTPLHGAAGGEIRPRQTHEGETEDVTLADKILAHDEMIAAILEGEARGDRRSGLMEQQNLVGKTPRQLREETLTRWRRREESMRRPPARRGRGRV
ncbi:hypothetical protein VF21_05488 [Pseudogymnoascus sp. 05NY08]|nr:hypothetical protein VF21_05488 [Pseudogymnoascus sp. 05NY08]